jgi:RNA polymerase sigma factor for flagellar operon FliA
VGIVSLSRAFSGGDSSREVREIDVLTDERQSNPLLDVARRDLKDVVTRGLSRCERLIVVLYYYEQMTMKEIGQVLDLSESRVSQMHTSVLARLKAQLQHRCHEIEDGVE